MEMIFKNFQGLSRKNGHPDCVLRTALTCASSTTAAAAAAAAAAAHHNQQ